MVVPPAGVDWDFLGFLTGRELVPLLGFGSGVGLDPPGFVSRRLSSVFSRVGVDAGLLRGSYSTPNLLGSGTVIAKVMPTARLGGLLCSSFVDFGLSSNHGRSEKRSTWLVQGRLCELLPFHDTRGNPSGIGEIHEVTHLGLGWIPRRLCTIDR